jgi:hypothetical protein
MVVLAGEEVHCEGGVSLAREDLALGREVATDEIGGHLGEEAGAVAGDGISVDGPAVGEVAEALEGTLNEGMRLLSTEVGDEADATCIAL